METPVHREVELPELEVPEVPRGEGSMLRGGGEVPGGRGEGLKEVYRQDPALERGLRRQNIVRLADGSLVRARSCCL